MALGVMETFVRYARVLQQQPHGLLPSAVQAFLDGRGVGHPSEVGAHVRAHVRVCAYALVCLCVRARKRVSVG